MARPIRTVQKVQVRSSDDRSLELKLLPEESEWCLMNSPAITTITVFEETTPGSLNLTSLYDRVALIVKKNPWLTGRLCMMPNGIQLFYGSHFVDCFQAVTRSSKFNFGFSYDDVAAIALPYAVKRGKECIDRDEPLFKVSILVHGEELKQFIIVFSVSKVVSDVHTFYKLYNMLNIDVEGMSLNATRTMDFGKTLRKVLGKNEMDWLHSSTSRQNGVTISSILSPRVRPYVFYIDDENWLPKAKRANQIGQNWVSTNDVLTSWFFKLCQCDFAVMQVNFRNRLLDLDDKSAGNYSENLIYRPNDFDIPLLIRNSLSGYRRAAQLENRYRRGTRNTPLPGVFASLRNNSAASENWSGAYKNLLVHSCIQILHIPILINYNELPYRNTMLIFKPTVGSIGMLLFKRDRHVVDQDYNPQKKNILKLPPENS